MKKVKGPEIKTRTDEMLALVQLEALAPRSVTTLSGGQQQRVALARALINRPRVLLLDEPLSALDLKLRQQMQVELRAIQRRVGQTFIFVTHDQEEALTLADRIAVMNLGKLEQVGTPEEIYGAPQTTFVARFIGSANFWEGEVVSQGGSVNFKNKAGAEFPVRSQNGKALGPCSLMLRPERIRIGEGAGFSGIVRDVIYRGATTDIWVDCPKLSSELIQISSSIASSSHSHVAVGSAVQISWGESDPLLFPRS
jgi:spermidine/putrescine transport system ATP-binding protein